jgi:hypothetical protein
MRWLLLALITLGPCVNAADFRDLNFGESCASADAAELSRGSERAPWTKESPDLHTFRGRELDRPAWILYLCNRDALHVGSIFFESKSPRLSAETFHEIYLSYIAQYGVPTLDNTPWRITQPSVPPAEPDPAKYNVSWRKNGTFRGMIFRHQSDVPDKDWVVAVSVGPS